MCSASNKMALNGTIETFRESYITDSLMEG